MDPQVSGRMDQPDERGGAPEPLRELIGRLESDERWDQLADVLDDAGRPLADGPSGPALRGEWLGHALHPLMTDLPLGCWTCSEAGRRAMPPAVSSGSGSWRPCRPRSRAWWS